MIFDKDKINELSPEEFEEVVRMSAQVEIDAAIFTNEPPPEGALRLLELPPGLIAERRRNHIAGGTLAGRYSVFWSDLDKEYVAIHSGFPSMSWLDVDPGQALAGLRKLINSDLIP